MSLGLGIVGIESYYGQAYAELTHERAAVEVVGGATTYAEDVVRELDRRTSAAFAGDFACPAHDSIDDVLATDAVDAVVVGTPTRRRSDDAVAAIEAGKHVLSAKPAADSPAAR